MATSPPTATPGQTPELIVFQSRLDGDDEIHVMASDGTGLTQLTRNDQVNDRVPKWSPDGNQIVFRSERNGDSQMAIGDSEDDPFARYRGDRRG